MFKNCILIILVIKISLLADVNLKCNAQYSSEAFSSRGVQTFANRVKKHSNGSVIIKVYPNNQLAKKSDIISGVQNGKFEMSDILISGEVDKEKVFGISSLPFIASNFKDAKNLYKMTKNIYEKALLKYNQKLLFSMIWSPSGIYGSKGILSFKDIKDLHSRTYDKYTTNFIKMGGGEAISLPWIDVKTALEQRKVDSVITSSAGSDEDNIWTFFKAFTKMNFAYPLQLVSINLDTWKSLDKNQQKAIKKAAYEVEKELWKIKKENYAKAMKIVQSRNIQIYEINKSFKKELDEEVAKVMVNNFLRDKKVNLDDFDPQLLQYLMLRFQQ